jgi:tetratricopeptide (TPR) repeat protein
LQPDYSEAHINLASLAQKLKSYGEAEDSFRKGLELRNDDSVANRGLGETLVELGRFSEAEACFRRAIEIDPDYSRPYHGLAMLLEGQQRYDEAEACYRTAIKLTDPGETPTAFPGTAMILPNDQAGVNRSNAAARQDLGRMFLRLRRFEEAEPLIRRAIELAPKMSEAHHSLGDVLSASARPDEAEACYRKAILLDPDSAAIYVNLGGLLVGQQRLADAESCFRSALKIQPDLSQAHLGLGNVLFFRGLHDEAIECLQTAVENQPNLIEALSTLGGMLASQQRWDEAESYLRQAIEQRPKFASAHLNLTVVLQRQGRLEDATAILQAALEELPDNAKLHCRLGRLFRMQGRFKEAVASLQRGHELGSNQAGWNVPSGQWLAEAQRDLVLDERLQEVVEGDTVPVDAEEMVSLAQLCQQPSKKLYRKAVALYEQAFESEPELAELRPNQPHRYNAACAAALAAAGAGIDASELGSEWQNNRRTQARQWLEADLTAWKALKDEPQSQTAAEQALSHWLSDPDLGSVREQTELAKLPEDERGKWESLWRDVRVAIGELRP